MTTYNEYFSSVKWDVISEKISSITRNQVAQAINREGRGGLEDFTALLSPIAASEFLEPMARLSHSLTQKRFGKAIRLFAPLYLSNECNNVCDYCGFSLGNKIVRKTLNQVELLREAGILKKMGFDHILLVTGESTRKVGLDYINQSLSTLRPYFSNLSIEVQPLQEEEYAVLKSSGLHAVLVYQETYNQESYAQHHLKGKKSNFEWRLATPDRLGKAGVHKIGLGCLFGLTKDWRADAFFAGHHMDYLQRKYWRTQYSMSFPRLRPCAGEIPPEVSLEDRDLVQLICAFRIFNHELEISISTRESSELRDHLLPLGVTTMSAGSKTNPGGYGEDESLEQFEISDSRSVSEVSLQLQQSGYDVVWKDWDQSYDQSNSYALSDDSVQCSIEKPDLSIAG
ncbi:MAG: 2-iminoacetate synthase ThiH [Opitutae bacterium]|nr:2-iminoacetate synthase ThiH [Opitutae bacterium]